MTALAATNFTKEDGSVQKWNNRVSFTGVALIEVLNQLAATQFGRSTLLPDPIRQLPVLGEWSWKNKLSLTNYQIKAIGPELLNNFPLWKLVHGTQIIGVVCKFATLKKVVVYVTSKDYLHCSDDNYKNTPYQNTLYTFHVKNFMDCEEANKINQLFLEYRRRPGKSKP